MIQYYCDMCGKTIHPETIHGRSFTVKYKDIMSNWAAFNVEEREWHMCDECYENLENYIVNRTKELKAKKGDTNEN